jgi:ribonucleoside-diphosphate reductase alpha chain
MDSCAEHLFMLSANHLQVMPSMRSMMTAGPALKKCNIAGYNCSYLPIDHPHAFDEVLYILMNGTGELVFCRAA